VTPGGTITTVAGDYALGAGYSGDGGPATSAQLSYPWDVEVDAVGNLYIADLGNNAIRKVTPGGTITTVAGNHSLGFGYSGDGGPATSAQLNSPAGVAVDRAGNLYIADTLNDVIRKVTTDGTITTIAGSFGSEGLGGASGPATSVSLDLPISVAVDGAGNLYIADSVDEEIRKVSPDQMITTVAGNWQSYGYYDNGGPATSAVFDVPEGVAVDGAGNLYITDSGNSLIRKIDFSDAPSLVFATTNVGEASAAQDVTVLNLGNAPLTIGHISTAANFSLSGSDTSCSERGQTLDSAESCVLGIEFNPEQAGAIQGSLVLADNTLNAGRAIQSIALQGTAPAPVPAATITALATEPGSVALGGKVTMTASVSSTTAGKITGNVTFRVGAKILGQASISGGTATLHNVIVNPANGFSLGSDSITATFGGDSDFAASSGSTNLTVRSRN
jgi:Bacterial Ig-like domain (group 3)/Abnormal spindle-like microcephaly-assoc'd, ASPM-SPD-2-Hydin/NHL repeat